ncbi:MAG: leucyl aminopeptidase [Methyloversatilis sp.]|uniref:leucyl aminopeptidase n=1 Tax=Methyloversatilis sp. TaxID=2569862 RepID=UPI00273431D0|nr:leucyl aminopeptidase [Methyloversatilis sp.]MDP3872745.1 leucyl aminopeptidase [Methyloversatilis sp.]
MEFSIKSGSPEKLRTGALIVGVYESRKLTVAAAALDAASKGRIGEITDSGDMDGKTGSTLLLHKLPGVAAERVLLVGLGKEKEFGAREYRDAVASAVRALRDTGASDAVCTLADEAPRKSGGACALRLAASTVLDVLYRYDTHARHKKDESRALAKMAFTLPKKCSASAAEEALVQGAAIGHGLAFTKTLGNLPPNVCTPTYLAEQALELGRKSGIAVTVLERADMQKLGMGSLLSVSAGTRQPPKFIAMEYRAGKKADAPVVLVGKGVTFDSGGISLKPGEGMDEMKYDMCGAASVLGTLQAIAAMKLPINVVGLIPTVENMPGGAATRPGDVVKSMSGQTIEILNTDAEGRLILCDALTYAERFEPACVVDIATLTGACIIALGHVTSGLMANDDALADELLAAGQSALDRAWRLPIWEDYQEQLKSNFADMGNIGGRPAGSITAACFLSRFTKKYKWAHLDIAGTAWKSGKDKGATGRPVPLLVNFLLERAGKL